jgi:Zn-finger nucleic acid-binding protein
MECPVCHTASLTRTQLEPQLPAYSCAGCDGIWIGSTDYWAWLDHRRLAGEESAAAGTPPSASDAAGAKRCPHCGYLLLGYRIRADIAFRLDQCGHCNSFWLDRNEWPALRALGLHDRLHKVAGEPWQRELRREEHQRAMQAIYAEKFGATDYAELRRVKAWLDTHPARHMLLAYLANEDPYAL